MSDSDRRRTRQLRQLGSRFGSTAGFTDGWLLSESIDDVGKPCGVGPSSGFRVAGFSTLSINDWQPPRSTRAAARQNEGVLPSRCPGSRRCVGSMLLRRCQCCNPGIETRRPGHRPPWSRVLRATNGGHCPPYISAFTSRCNWSTVAGSECNAASASELTRFGVRYNLRAAARFSLFLRQRS